MNVINQKGLKMDKENSKVIQDNILEALTCNGRDKVLPEPKSDDFLLSSLFRTLAGFDYPEGLDPSTDCVIRLVKALKNKVSRIESVNADLLWACKLAFANFPPIGSQGQVIKDFDGTLAMIKLADAIFLAEKA